jgi:simple sugar transport system substrate-binding protein
MDDYMSVAADSPYLPEGNKLLAVDLQNDGKIGIDAISPRAKDEISSEIIDLVEKSREQMIAGVWDPFYEYELVSSGKGVSLPGLEVPSEGTVVKPANTPISDEFLLAELNFQLEGIQLIE